MKFPLRVLSLCCLLCLAVFAYAQNAPVILEDEFTFASSFDSLAPLYAKVVYPEGAKSLPLMVVQHGYDGNRNSVNYSARRMAARGYFCLCIDTRGWGGSAGKHDDGGLEIMDIYDGIQATSGTYAKQIDPKLISIIGYSNGGGNVFFSTVRFPYLFRGAMALFGISDYGMWANMSNSFRAKVQEAVGGSPAELPDKYLARNAIIAAGNLHSGTRFHIAYDEAETLCPVPMDDLFVMTAQTAKVENIFTHVSKTTDEQRWLHSYNTQGHLSAIEDRFMDDLEQSQAVGPVMPESGELTVIGFLVTPRFTCILGKGDDAVAHVKYAFEKGKARFEFSAISYDSTAAAKVTLTDFEAPGDMQLLINGRRRGKMKKGEPLQAQATISSTVVFTR